MISFIRIHLQRVVPRLLQGLLITILLAACNEASDSQLATQTSVAADQARSNVQEFSEAFTGGGSPAAPTNPLSWNPDNWDVQVHVRSQYENPATTMAHKADHGPNCEAPGADGLVTHTVDNAEDSVYQCADHVMTSFRADDYGVILLTPPALADFSSEEATISFDLSTLSNSRRDWPAVVVQPFNDNLALPIDSDLPDLNGYGRSAIQFDLVDGSICPIVVREFEYDEGRNKFEGSCQWSADLSELTESAANKKVRFEIKISRTRIQVGVPELGLVWDDMDIADLGWDKGLVSLVHHSYNPFKDGNGGPNTWHWDNLTIAPALPIFINQARERWTNLDESVFHFSAAAPENTFLRGSAIGTRLEVSFDGGTSWEQSQRQDSFFDSDAKPTWQFWHPVPIGTTSVMVRAGDKSVDWWSSGWVAKDLSLFSLNGSESEGFVAINDEGEPEAVQTDTVEEAASVDSSVLPDDTTESTIIPDATEIVQTVDSTDAPNNSDQGASEADSLAALVIYDDALRNGLQNWSWATANLSSTQQVAQGDFAIAVDFSPWSGLYFALNEDLPIPTNGVLEFSIYSSESQELEVRLFQNQNESPVAVTVNADPGVWKNISIPLAELGAGSTMSGVWWQERRGKVLPTIYLDNINIVGGSSLPPQEGIDLQISTESMSLTRAIVDPSTGLVSNHVIDFPHAISEDIYGVNFVTNALREELKTPVNRWGGNATERYNFQTSSTNQGADWFFTNNPGEPNEADVFEQNNQDDGTKTILTIPMLGWVSAGREGSCSYPTAIAGDQDSTTSHWVDPFIECGNGYRNGVFLGTADPLLTSVEKDETFAADWVRALVAKHGTAASGGVELYALGNEPGLWHSTHKDVVPAPMSRDNIIERNIRYAKAIKTIDPSAEVIGPVLWSGSSYYVSSDELLAGIRPGQVPTFLADYLGQMSAAEGADGLRLIDRLAVNFYDDRVYAGGTDRLRLESTRQLWDPTYSPDDWWVARDFLYGNGSAVIPRLKTLVADNYPGTPLAITEYNFGGVETLVGALTQIDALGIFGREELDMATIWEPYSELRGMSEQEFNDRPIFWAFRMFRNYDAQGSRFGDTALHAESSDENTVSIFAARHSNSSQTNAILVNKSSVAQSVTLSGAVGRSRVYRYSGANDRAIEPMSDMVLTGNDRMVLPAYSATLLDILQ